MGPDELSLLIKHLDMFLKAPCVVNSALRECGEKLKAECPARKRLKEIIDDHKKEEWFNKYNDEWQEYN